MFDDFMDVIRSLRRSRTRVDVLAATIRLGRATLEELAESSGYPAERVRAAIEGGLPGFRRESSLAAMVLVRVEATALGPVYEATERAHRAQAALRERPTVPAPRARA